MVAKYAFEIRQRLKLLSDAISSSEICNSGVKEMTVLSFRTSAGYFQLFCGAHEESRIFSMKILGARRGELRLHAAAHEASSHPASPNICW
jgi:hypothetical protein